MFFAASNLCQPFASHAGSAVAFGKLHGMLASAPLNLPGKNVANLSMAAGSLAAGAALLTTGDPATGLVHASLCNDRAGVLYCCRSGVVAWVVQTVNTSALPPRTPLSQWRFCSRRLHWWRQLRSAAAWGRT